LLVGGVFEGVGHFGGFAESTNAAAVPGADDESGDGGEKDVSLHEVRIGVEGFASCLLRTHSRWGSG
jgi:hypothetical protein